MTHGSLELDEEAKKFVALGADPGPELEKFDHESRDQTTKRQPEAGCILPLTYPGRNLERLAEYGHVALVPCPACGAMADCERSGDMPAHRRERAAMALWRRFGSPHQIEWNEARKAEYLAAIDAIVEAFNGR